MSHSVSVDRISDLGEIWYKWFLGMLNHEELVNRGWGRDLGRPERVFFLVEEVSPEVLEQGYNNLMAQGRPVYQSISYYAAGPSSNPLRLSSGVLAGLEKVFFDLDVEGVEPSKAKELALREAKQLYDYLRSYGEPLIVFSGKKGYHIYLWLPSVVSDMGVYKYLIDMLGVNKLELRYLDTKVLEPARISRIPYTLHHETKQLVTPLDSDFRPIAPESFDLDAYITRPMSKEILEKAVELREAQHRLEMARRYWIQIDLSRTLYGIRETSKTLLPTRIEELVDNKAVPPCIKKQIKEIVETGELDHYQRIALVLYLKWVGFSVDQVVEFFKRYAKDFNERITRYQVEYLYGKRGKREDWLMYSCRKLKELGICLDCGWNRNPVTYTYSRAHVPEEIKQRFYDKARGQVNNHAGYQIGSSPGGLGQATVTLSRIQIAVLPDWLRDFLRDTGLREFTYDDLKRWFEGKGGVTAKQWHNIARTLRKLAEQGLLGRKFLVDGQWIDYGSRKIRAPPSKTVKFYVKDNGNR